MRLAARRELTSAQRPRGRRERGVPGSTAYLRRGQTRVSVNMKDDDDYVLLQPAPNPLKVAPAFLEEAGLKYEVRASRHPQGGWQHAPFVRAINPNGKLAPRLSIRRGQGGARSRRFDSSAILLYHWAQDWADRRKHQPIVRSCCHVAMFVASEIGQLLGASRATSSASRRSRMAYAVNRYSPRGRAATIAVLDKHLAGRDVIVGTITRSSTCALGVGSIAAGPVRFYQVRPSHWSGLYSICDDGSGLRRCNVVSQ